MTEGDAGGVKRMDEAAAAALAGEFDELAPAAWCCCYMLYACEREMRPPMVAEATVRLAEPRRRQGRLEDANEMFGRVAEHSRALLGLGEVCLERGDPACARDRAEQYLRARPRARHGRCALRRSRYSSARKRLWARVSGRRRHCASSTPSLTRSPAIQCALLRHSAPDSSPRAVARRSGLGLPSRMPVRLFARSGALSAAAGARLQLAAALRALGREDAAREEIEAALAVLRDLGAVAEVARAEAMLGPATASEGPGPLDGLTKRELQVLALVAEDSRAPVISEHTVKRHVANTLRKLELPSRAAAASPAGQHGLRRLPPG